jgi:FkbM family methyltransferase
VLVYNDIVIDLEANGVSPGQLCEQIITRFYSDFVTEGESVVDGGAHVGRHALELSKLVGSTGTVFAFEPVAEIMLRLLAKVKKTNSKNIVLFTFALSDVNKVVEFSYAKGAPAFSGLKERVYPQNVVVDVDKRLVAAVRLEELIPARNRITFIKLDLEGGEYPAMKGARRILENDRPVIVFENGRQRAAETYGYTKAGFFAFFNGIEYGLFTIDGQPFGPDRWRTYPFPFYFWAVPLERADVIGDLEGWMAKGLEDIAGAGSVTAKAR